MRDYIAYAKECINPRLTDEASQRLIQAYVDMRKAGLGKGQITAYPRQLESLIRLSEAHAKVRLSELVEVSDVEEAWRLHREAVKQSATDPTTGKIDVTILTTGVSSTSRKRRAELCQTLRRLLESKGRVQTVNYQKTFGELKEQSSWVRIAELQFYFEMFVMEKVHLDSANFTSDLLIFFSKSPRRCMKMCCRIYRMKGQLM